MTECSACETPRSIDLQLLIACDEGDLQKVRTLVEENEADVCYQDFETGLSVLMVAASAGHQDLVRYLLDEGAPWNAVDRMYLCAGDYAAKHGHQQCVDVLLDHAVMCELLLSLTLNCHDDSDDEPDLASEASVLKATNPRDPPKESLNASYLSSRLVYTDDGTRLVDTSTQLAVMMDWERPLMALHAAWICHADSDLIAGVRVLNVGFGMGIVDMEIQKHKPLSHVIIEAHPQVLKKLELEGWSLKPGVRIVPTRWQDAVRLLAEEIDNHTSEPFDGIFFDTYAEDDLDLREFHTWLPKLLRQSTATSDGSTVVPTPARYSYYNGVCPDNVFFHGVACETIRLHLNRLGLDCQFDPIAVNVSDPKLWEKLDKRYWYFDHYFLPKCVYRPVVKNGRHE